MSRFIDEMVEARNRLLDEIWASPNEEDPELLEKLSKMDNLLGTP